MWVMARLMSFLPAAAAAAAAAVCVVTRHVFHGVHMLLQFSSSAEGAGRPWAAGEKRYCKLVFIGKNLNRQELTQAFNACLVPADGSS